jgi:hypothetical protein
MKIKTENRLRVNCTAQEKFAWNRAAAQQDMNLSQWTRMILTAALTKPGQPDKNK